MDCHTRCSFDKEDAMKAIGLASEVIEMVKKDLKMADK